MEKVIEKITCELLGCGNTFLPKRFWNPLSYNKARFCSKKCQMQNWMIKKVNSWREKSLIVFFLFFIMCSPSFASTPEYFNCVVDAIFLAEGGDRAKVPYGILSVKVSSKEEARKVCYNTVRNNWKRWEAAGRPGTYLSFLANRYCPVGAPNDPKGLNKNWLCNVERLMR